MKTIGIDPGTSTGFAIWHCEEKRFLTIETKRLHEVLFLLRDMKKGGERIFVRFEDARKRKWFGNAGREKLQGVGYVKAHCSIIEEALKDMGIPYQAVAPAKGMTKWSKETFERITGWKRRTSEHARDAAALVHGLTKGQVGFWGRELEVVG